MGSILAAEQERQNFRLNRFYRPAWKFVVQRLLPKLPAVSSAPIVRSC